MKLAVLFSFLKVTACLKMMSWRFQNQPAKDIFSVQVIHQTMWQPLGNHIWIFLPEIIISQKECQVVCNGTIDINKNEVYCMFTFFKRKSEISLPYTSSKTRENTTVLLQWSWPCECIIDTSQICFVKHRTMVSKQGGQKSCLTLI